MKTEHINRMNKWRRDITSRGRDVNSVCVAWSTQEAAIKKLHIGLTLFYIYQKKQNRDPDSNEETIGVAICRTRD